MYMLNPDTDELQPKVKIEKTVNEDGREENVWANGKTYYSYTLGEGLQTDFLPAGMTCPHCGGKSGFDRKQYSGCIRCVI